MAEDFLTRLRDTPPGIPESAPDLVGLRRRATGRKARRVLLVVVAAVLLASVGASLIWPQKHEPKNLEYEPKSSESEPKSSE